LDRLSRSVTRTFPRFLIGPFARAPIVLCAGFSAFVLVLCVLAGIHFKHAVEQQFYSETQNIAQILMAGFDDDAAAADGILRRVAAEIPESEVARDHEPELHRLLAGYALQPSMIGPAIVDRNGALIASAQVDRVPELSLKDRNIFRFHAEASGTPQLYVGAPTRTRIADEWAIQFSRPLRDASGGFFGVVLLSYRLEHFIRLYEKLKLSDRGLAGLVGKDGVVRIRSLNGEIGYGSAVPRIPLVYDRVLAGQMSGTIYNQAGGPDDVMRIGSFVASASTPFYVTVAYDTAYLRAQYSGFFYALGLCWLALTVAMAAAASFIHRLAKLGQQAELQIVASATAERQKISADMHDSIGASLAALLAYLTTENINVVDVKRRIGEILMELRFLVDSAETDDRDLNLLLSSVRHRMGSSIELAGINLQWQAGALPRIEGLTARDALSIKLILMEALSNVLHHSKARTAALTAGFIAPASVIVMAVSDDGCGFDLADTAAGRGLANMRRRIASISSGAKIFIEAAPGRGTAVRIELNARPRA
jgi:signal transduction histidine kinase